MSSNQKVIIGLVILAIIVFIVFKMQKHEIKSIEPYKDLFYATDYAQGKWVSRPDFKADLSPRFDSTRVGGGNIVGSFPGLEVQASPLTPVESILSASVPNYASMGGPDGAYTDPRLPAGGFTTSQVNKILANKFGRGTSDTPEMTEANQLLPTPDLKKALARNPADANTFMYDRYLFAPLKRRYGKVEVDHIRGDLPVKQVRMGWFDPSPVAKQDITSGYFQNYLDIQQSTAIQDSVFERNPTPVQQETPWARLAEKTVYSVL